MTDEPKKRGRPPGGIREHLPEMREMRQAGATYQQIADKYQVSRQRIHQLLSEQETQDEVR